MHPSLPPLPQTNFTPMMQAEIDRKARGEPMKGGIDMSRYEAPDEPTDGDESQWREALQAVYRSSSYLEGRQVNLSLLEEYGKNAWLIGNSQLEDMLRQAEKELELLKDETDTINKARKGAQEESRGELTALEGSWRTGVGKIIEVQIASDSLRKEMLKRRRIH
jgi:pre-mRNA-splicing factor SPF27